jgi:hypothetical protein
MTLNQHLQIVKSTRNIVRFLFAILTFLNVLLNFFSLRQTTIFYGEDYSMWSYKMRRDLTSLHESIWDIVEFGAQAPHVGDEDYNSNEAAQVRHFNSQV